MSQQKHTPGPYSYGEDNDGWYLESLSAKEKLGYGKQPNSRTQRTQRIRRGRKKYF